MLSDRNPSSWLADEPLAIVGMACRLPGADDLNGFWDMLVNGRSGVKEVPAEQLDRRLYSSNKRSERSKTYSTISGLIEQRPNDPSSDFRKIEANDVCWDPCHQTLFGVVEDALAHGNWSRGQLKQSRTGTYVGHSSGSPLGGELVLASIIPDVANLLSDLSELKSLSSDDRHRILAEVVTAIQSRRPQRCEDGPNFESHYASQLIARRLQLDGPQMVIDAACASSLMAMALAGAALVRGEIEQAIVAGASYYKTDSLILFSQAQSCSAKGSRPFDADADGLVNSEGYAVLLLKTLKKATEAGDTVHGVIRGIGLSSDGRGRSLWAPRKEGQLAALSRAYSDEVIPQSVQYVEAHATSTQVGDATEMEALASFFSQRHNEGKIPLGSVKSNVGHTLETAGLASVIKCLLSMKNGLIPPTINLANLNPSIDWDNNPLTPVRVATPWPDRGREPRRSAVNAFGIGGLNVHVVVDGPLEISCDRRTNGVVPKRSLAISTSSADGCPLAIIGRGLILPGANNVHRFGELIEAGESQLVPPPSNRWRDTPFYDTRPAIRDAYQRARGGYILNYQYDWRTHRIPPRQIDQANPLQFMLLDAAQQALEESGYGDKPFDRDRAAVIVGTLFGGEFSHQLQVGLRLPEIMDQLSTALKRRGWSKAQILKLCGAAEERIVNQYPAINDQSGSFTSSTQASRIAKTLNIMGGAMAIDCGDGSSLAALQSAQHLIAAGAIDFVFCATAQRCLDAIGFEAWNLHRPEYSSHGDGSIVPGEGVVVLLLRRLIDAQNAGDPVFGVIRHVHATRIEYATKPHSRNGKSRPWHATSTTTATHSSESSRFMRQFGHLQGASGMLEILGLTVANEDPTNATDHATIRSSAATCELEARVDFAPVTDVARGEAMHNGTRIVGDIPVSQTRQNAKVRSIYKYEVCDASNQKLSPRIATPKAPIMVEKANDLKVFRIWGVDDGELILRLQTLSNAPKCDASAFPARAPYRMAIVATSETVCRKIEVAINLLGRQQSLNRAQDDGIFYRGPMDIAKPLMVGMFPGQGSQYRGMLSDMVESSSAVCDLLKRVDQSARQRGWRPPSEWLQEDFTATSSDLRMTQLAMLTADVSAYEMAKEFGLRPDYLVGHSFGEYAAFVASETIDFESAVAMANGRADAIASCEHAAGSMLSISGTFAEIHALLAGRKDVFVSHTNSLRQTVIAGSKAAVEAFSGEVAAKGFAAVAVPVSSPFHTPLLASASPVLKTILQQHRWRPPRIPVMSTVSGRFVVDRDVIIDNLSSQLSVPVDWVGIVERLIDEDVRVFVEIGPGRVLTRLTQQIAGDRPVFAVSIDEPRITLDERRLRIEAALEVAGIKCAIQQSVGNGSLKRMPIGSPAVPKSEQAYTTVSSVAAPPQVLDVNPAKLIEEVADPTPVAIDGIETSNEESNDLELTEFIVNIIVEQTGYPRDVIELDWDLEADLGIDSIRKAQILGELSEYFDLNSIRSTINVQDLRTIRDIVATLKTAPGKSDWLRRPVEPTSASPPDDVSDNGESLESSRGDCTKSDSAESTIANCQNDRCDSSLDQFLVDFLVERTGFSRDAVELDADLEDDLGVDAVTIAQMLGQLSDRFGVCLAEVDVSSSVSTFRTLRSIGETINAARSAGNDQKAVLVEAVELNGASMRSSPSSSNHRPTLPASKSELPLPGLLFPRNSEYSSGFRRGQVWGKDHREELQRELFDLADRVVAADLAKRRPSLHSAWNRLTLDQDAELRGIADGADVHPQCLMNLKERLLVGGRTIISTNRRKHQPVHRNVFQQPPEPVESHPRDSSLTHRYRLTMTPEVIRHWSGNNPELVGGAIVIGNQADARALVQRLKSFGVPVAWLKELGTRDDAILAIESIWTSTPSPNLFVMSCRDPLATTTLDESAWRRRRQVGIASLYWFCQRWVALLEEASLFDDARLFGITSLGGDFGISQQIHSAEGGAIAGLLKSIMIECWVNGYRTFVVKALDFSPRTSPTELVDAVCVELSEASYDTEIGWDKDRRRILTSLPAPLKDASTSRFTPTGNWVVTGGARGITAHLVKKMAAKYPRIHFHLVGTAPLPNVSPEQRELAASDPKGFRDQFIRGSKHKSQSPLKAWQEMEKQLEIDRMLDDMRCREAEVTYHSCDVADREQLQAVLEEIRRQAGEVCGVIHGAGIGKDASFQRKDPAMVERCLAAKIDGAINLMALTTNDPLQAFIAFGSISGRFGANGHTDYSAANDMLAKLMVWHRQVRSSVPSTVIHWHAWDDIGMATKPETRLALEMIGMKLMPAREGSDHFLREIAAGLPDSEVVITDDRYYRLFYPADRVQGFAVSSCAAGESSANFPLVRNSRSTGSHMTVSDAVLNPVLDPFLIEHRLRNRPLLPMVIMAELLAEGAAISHNRQRPTSLSDLEILGGIKFPTDAPLTVEVSSVIDDSGKSKCELRADIRSRDGKLVDTSRLYAKATIDFIEPTDPSITESLELCTVKSLDWKAVVYPTAGAEFYSGKPLQCLRKVAIDPTDQSLWGRIGAPLLSELAGLERDVSNWITPSAVFDATLFACGILTWNCVRPGIALPSRLQQLWLIRQPRPAEVCWVRTRIVEFDVRSTTFDITLWGSDGQPLFVVQKYVATWIST